MVEKVTKTHLLNLFYQIIHEDYIYRTLAHKFMECFKLISDVTEILTCNKMKVSLGPSMLGGGILVQAVEERDAQVHSNGSNKKKSNTYQKIKFHKIKINKLILLVFL